MDDAWDPLSIEEIADRFSATTADWWIAGGLAIDLFLGWETRHHDDVDVEMFRGDRAVLADVFGGWDLVSVSEGVRSPWTPDTHLPPSVFGIWGRTTGEGPWRVEVILADGNRTEWRFRRDPRITMPGDRLIRTTADGIPYCAPEVQLLYKAKQSRQKDDADLARCLHRLDDSQKGWLLESVATTMPDHPWVRVLSEAPRLNAGGE